MSRIHYHRLLVLGAIWALAVAANDPEADRPVEEEIGSPDVHAEEDSLVVEEIGSPDVHAEEDSPVVEEIGSPDVHADEATQLIVDLTLEVFWQVHGHVIKSSFGTLISRSSTLARIRDRQLLPVIMEILLSSDGPTLNGCFPSKQLALALWASTPSPLGGRRDLFMRLLLQPELLNLRESASSFRKLVRSLSSSVLSDRDGEGRTVLEAYFHLSVNGDIQFDATIASHLIERSPLEAVDHVRSQSLTFLKPWIWAKLFHNRNMQILSQFDNFNEFSQAVVGQHPDSCRFLLAVVVYKMFKERDWDFCPVLDCNAELLASSDNLFQGLSLWQSRDSYSDLIERLAYYCYPQGCLDRIPRMLAGFTQSLSLIERIAFNLLDDTIFVLFWEILHFHMQQNDAIQFYIMTKVEETHLLPLLNRLSLSIILYEGDDLEFSSTSDSIRHAIESCAQVQDDIDKRSCSNFLLCLALRSIFEKHQWTLLNDLSSIPDDQLRHALIMNSLYSTFNGNMKAVRIQNPAVYSRFAALVPEKLSQTSVSSSPANSDVPASVGRYRMAIRTVDHLSDEYVILGQLGRGGFGSVFRARPARGPVHLEVAIKMQSSTVHAATEADFMSRYCHSAQVPGLVRLLDVFKCRGHTFVVMELIQGYTVQNWPIPDDETEAAQQLIWITYQMMCLLHRMHQIGYCHGDLQHLNNFMVDTNNSNALVLLDFSLSQARCRQCHDDLTPLYHRLILLLEDVKEHVGLRWYESNPGLLLDYETALKSWPTRSWTCADLVQDPIFDAVRQIPIQHIDRYSEWPDITQQLIDTEAPPPPSPLSHPSPFSARSPVPDPTSNVQMDLEPEPLPSTPDPEPQSARLDSLPPTADPKADSLTATEEHGRHQQSATEQNVSHLEANDVNQQSATAYSVVSNVIPQQDSVVQIERHSKPRSERNAQSLPHSGRHSNLDEPEGLSASWIVAIVIICTLLLLLVASCFLNKRSVHLCFNNDQC